MTRMDECPLGAAALAGTGFPIDRNRRPKRSASASRRAIHSTAYPTATSRWSFLSLASICATHLSRLAEEIVIWSTPQFGFIRLSDRFSTGSSIMPQKKNPDAAELVRAKTGRINGALITLLTVMKGLPLAYSKDMQEDKEAVFDAAENLELAHCGDDRHGLRHDNQYRGHEAAPPDPGYSTATDLADWLVRETGMPFREAHHVTGAAVALAEKKQCGLEDLSLAESADPRSQDHQGSV